MRRRFVATVLGVSGSAPASSAELVRHHLWNLEVAVFAPALVTGASS